MRSTLHWGWTHGFLFCLDMSTFGLCFIWMVELRIVDFYDAYETAHCDTELMRGGMSAFIQCLFGCQR